MGWNITETITVFAIVTSSPAAAQVCRGPNGQPARCNTVVIKKSTMPYTTPGPASGGGAPTYGAPPVYGEGGGAPPPVYGGGGGQPPAYGGVAASRRPCMAGVLVSHRQCLLGVVFLRLPAHV
jgi:hypothetical protein